ncbi:MAG: hypothetical protein CFE25_04465 [Chitinophagaceae bacterium BSSC1]|nr:MAG: hypothetical protein CFE25_04465 [Chitinophagaceae bacterium BSSC1]
MGACFWVNLLQAQPIEKIYLNPKNPTIQKQSSYVDSIQFLPLASVEGIVFNEYANVRLTEKYFLITDNAAGYLYIYTKNGAFLKQINYKSQITNLYPSYNSKTNEIVFFGNNSNYTLTSKDRVKIQLDWSNEHNLKYFKKYVINLQDTTFAIKKVKPTKYDLIGAYPFYANQYVQTKINTSTLYKDSIGYELSVYEKEQLVKNYFPYNRVNEPKFLFSEESVGIALTEKLDLSYLLRPYCDTIYQSVKGVLTPLYQLVMPLENSLSPNFFIERPDSKADRENFKRNNGWLFHQIRDFYETPKLIYLTISFFSHYEVFVYDKQTHTAYNANKIKGDAKQYNLSLLTPYNIVRSGQRFYKLLKADMIGTFLKQHPEVEVPKELAADANKLSDKNGLLVVAFKLKD